MLQAMSSVVNPPLFRLLSLSRQCLAALCCAIGLAVAGPVIVGGTDADDHGSSTATANLGGWLYMQKVLEAQAPLVTKPDKKVVCLGCNSLVALSAFISAFDKSILPANGWTRAEVNSGADISAFFASTGTHKLSNTSIVYMPSDANNVAGGLNTAQLDLINLAATDLANHINAGGGLFSQTQGGQANGFGWLKTLQPDLTTSTAAILPSMMQASTALPSHFAGLNNTVFAEADQWHNYFNLGTGGLAVLATGKATVAGVEKDVPVLLGGANVVTRKSGKDTVLGFDHESQQVPLSPTLTGLLILLVAGLSKRSLRR
jgi:hypothetical protein